MNRVHTAFIPPLPRFPAADRWSRLMGSTGTRYGEYDGIFTVHEFVVRPDDHVAVAPFDVPFREPGHPTEPPAIEDIAPISLQAFEALLGPSAPTCAGRGVTQHTELYDKPALRVFSTVCGFNIMWA